MSAYIVSDETISVLAKGLFDFGLGYNLIKSDVSQLTFVNNRVHEIGQILLDQNYKSVNHRYIEDMPTHTFQYKEIEYDWGILKGCIDCYNYQACETDDYFESIIYRNLLRLQDLLLERIIKSMGQEIVWGL